MHYGSPVTKDHWMWVVYEHIWIVRNQLKYMKFLYYHWYEEGVKMLVMDVAKITITRRDHGEIEMIVSDAQDRIEQAYEVSRASPNQVKNIILDCFTKV